MDPSCTKTQGSGMWRELLECPDWGRGDTTGMGSGAKGQQHQGGSPEPEKAIFRLLVRGVGIGLGAEYRNTSTGREADPLGFSVRYPSGPTQSRPSYMIPSPFLEGVSLPWLGV